MQKIYRAKKSLGQNFLKSESALRKIIEAGKISEKDLVLEIGPGKGALTSKILDTGCNLIAVEKDRDLFELLKIKFEKNISSSQLKLINEDILKYNLDSYNLKANSYKLIANIPYNITGAIFKKFLGGVNNPKRMVLMIQHEVAKRILARDKKESILSISVKVYGIPKLIMKVPARYFSPAPKVDSAIILIENISKDFFEKNKIDEKFFWEIIHSGFAHKRKKLSSNLKKYKKILGENEINDLKNKRAEELSISDWLNLIKSNKYQQKK